jgi:hypothetical protein
MRLLSIESEEKNKQIQLGIRKFSVFIFIFKSSTKRIQRFTLVLFSTEAFEKLDSFWLSANDLGYDGDFYWDSTGASLGNFDDWMEGEPAVDTEKNCAHMSIKSNSSDERRWKVADCDTKFRYVCESIPPASKDHVGSAQKIQNSRHRALESFRFRNSVYEISTVMVKLP